MDETHQTGIFLNVIEYSHHAKHTVDKAALRSIPGLGRMLYTTFAVSIAAFASGTTEGWSSPMILILSAPDTTENPIKKTMSIIQTNQMVTLMKISSIVNTMLCGFLSDRLGRRAGAWMVSLLVPIGWALLATVSDIEVLYIGVILIGTTTMSGLLIGIIILSEMADDNVRGSLISIIVFWYSCGVLAAHVLGEICNFHIFNWVGFSISILSAILLYTLPESPQYLILKNRVDDARRSVEWYHGSDPAVIEDRMNNLKKTKSYIDCQKFMACKGQRLSLIIIVFLNAFGELGGTTVIETYAGPILADTERPAIITAGEGALILACIRFFAGLCSCYLIERTGRKVTLILSFAKMALALAVLSILFWFTKEQGWVLQIYPPLVCLIVYTLANQMYLGTNEVISGEIASPSIRGLLMAIGGSTKIIVSILCLQAYSPLEMLGKYGNFMCEACFCVMGAIISFYIVPETRGKSLNIIRDELRGELPKRANSNGVKSDNRRTIEVESSDGSVI